MIVLQPSRQESDLLCRFAKDRVFSGQNREGERKKRTIKDSSTT